MPWMRPAVAATRPMSRPLSCRSVLPTQPLARPLFPYRGDRLKLPLRSSNASAWTALRASARAASSTCFRLDCTWAASLPSRVACRVMVKVSCGSSRLAEALKLTLCSRMPSAASAAPAGGTWAWANDSPAPRRQAPPAIAAWRARRWPRRRLTQRGVMAGGVRRSIGCPSIRDDPENQGRPRYNVGECPPDDRRCNLDRVDLQSVARNVTASQNPRKSGSGMRTIAPVTNSEPPT